MLSTTIQLTAPTPPTPPPKLSLHLVHDVVHQLWGAVDKAAPTPSIVPWLQTQPLLRDTFHAELAKSEPRDWFAQSRVEGCECMVILTRLQDAPVIVLLPVDPRLQLSAENYIQILPVPHTIWRSATAMFNGTLMCGVRTGEKGIILYDVAVTCGSTLVGSGAPKATFVKRMGVLTEIANNLRSLLKTEGWCILEAPWTQCGTNQPLALYDSVKPRGVFFINNTREVDAPRLVWVHHMHINMSLCGATWFVGGKDGAISSVIPNVRIDVDEKVHGSMDDIVPMSLGRFDPQVEHADKEKGLCFCQRWLVLHEIEPAVRFQNFDLPHWECVRFYCDTKESVAAKFSALRQRLDWEAEVSPFIQGGIVVSPGASACKQCTFAPTNAENEEGTITVARRHFDEGTERASRRPVKRRKRRRLELDSSEEEEESERSERSERSDDSASTPSSPTNQRRRKFKRRRKRRQNASPHSSRRQRRKRHRRKDRKKRRRRFRQKTKKVEPASEPATPSAPPPSTPSARTQRLERRLRLQQA